MEPKSHESHKNTMRMAIINMSENGAYGNGKSTTLNTLEDIAEYCVLYANLFGITSEYAVKIMKEIIEESE